MRRRLWILILGLGLGAGALPGCATPAANLFKSPCSQNDRPAGAAKGQLGQQGHYPGEEEAEAFATANASSGRSTSPYLQRSYPSGVSGPLPPLPAGQRVVEFMAPPTVLPPRELPPPADPGLMQQPMDADNPPRVVNQSPIPPPPPEQPLVNALYYLLHKQSAEALNCLQRFDHSNQDLYMGLLSALAVLNDKGVDQLGPGEIAALQEQLQGLLASLRKRAELVIDKMVLCERIESYGQYLAVRDGHAFQAGTQRQAGDLVQVYIELRNIACEQRGGYFVTALNGTMTIHDAQGTPVWSYNYRKREPLLRSLMPRSDCFRAYDFFVPAMPPGKYTLTIDIVDETYQLHRTARKSVEFLVAPPAGQ
jgi:hypothetical protein